MTPSRRAAYAVRDAVPRRVPDVLALGLAASVATVLAPADLSVTVTKIVRGATGSGDRP